MYIQGKEERRNYHPDVYSCRVRTRILFICYITHSSPKGLSFDYVFLWFCRLCVVHISQSSHLLDWLRMMCFLANLLRCRLLTCRFISLPSAESLASEMKSIYMIWFWLFKSFFKHIMPRKWLWLFLLTFR